MALWHWEDLRSFGDPLSHAATGIQTHLLKQNCEKHPVDFICTYTLSLIQLITSISISIHELITLSVGSRLRRSSWLEVEVVHPGPELVENNRALAYAENISKPRIRPHSNDTSKQYDIHITRGCMKTLVFRSEFDFEFSEI
jgi:hypothetical protein